MVFVLMVVSCLASSAYTLNAPAIADADAISVHGWSTCAMETSTRQVYSTMLACQAAVALMQETVAVPPEFREIAFCVPIPVPHPES